MSRLVLANIYLEAEQKKALERKAKRNGTNLSVEVRNAVDAYNTGMTVEELELLDAASLAAKKAIDESVAILDHGAKRAEKFFAEIDAIKRGKAA